MLDFDEVRREVTIHHNVLFGKDNPILATVMVNELVLDWYLDLVSDQYDEANHALTLTLQQRVKQSKETTGKIITEAANYVSDQMRQAVAEAVKGAGRNLRRQVAEIQAVSRDAVASGRGTQVAKNSAVVAAVLSGVAALVAMATLMVVLLK